MAIVSERYRGYKPCLWSYRILDKEAGTFEIVHNSRTPRTHNMVTVDADGRASCTCASGRRQFRNLKRGYCMHIHALMTFALQYRGVGPRYSYGYVYAPENGFRHYN